MDERRQLLKARIDLFEESIFLTEYNRTSRGSAPSSNPSACREISPLDLTAALSGVEYKSPLLPEGCVSWSRVDGKDQFVIYIYPHRWKVRLVQMIDHVGEMVLTLPFPPLVWVGCGLSYRLWAVERRPEKRSDRLFIAPFPNVYGRDGAVCWGDIDPPEAKSETVLVAYRAFIESNFNGHLANGCSRKHAQDVRLMWQDLAAPGPKGPPAAYPLDDLLKTHHTLGEIL